VSYISSLCAFSPRWALLFVVGFEIARFIIHCCNNIYYIGALRRFRYDSSRAWDRVVTMRIMLSFPDRKCRAHELNDATAFYVPRSEARESLSSDEIKCINVMTCTEYNNTTVNARRCRHANKRSSVRDVNGTQSSDKYTILFYIRRTANCTICSSVQPRLLNYTRPVVPWLCILHTVRFHWPRTRDGTEPLVES